jgi:hypothetical protein
MARLNIPRRPFFGRYQGWTGGSAEIAFLAVQKRARAKNAQNCFLYRLLLVVVASTFGFQIDEIETEFLRAV